MEIALMKKVDCRNSWCQWAFWRWSFDYHNYHAIGFRFFGVHFEFGDIFESAWLQKELEEEFGNEG
jgi:hypothetical protein